MTQDDTYTVGIEEELFVLEAHGGLVERRLDPRVHHGQCAAGQWKPEIFQAMVETNSEISDSVGEAVQMVLELRERICDQAEREDARLLAMGLHPNEPNDGNGILVTPDERYIHSDWAKGPYAEAAMTAATHVHVGIKEELKWRATRAVRPWLPVLAAMSASSPWRKGKLTGFKSNRLVVRKQMPSGETPPWYGCEHEGRESMEALERMARTNETANRFEVRASPRYPTVEIRIFDQMARRENVEAIVAMSVALVRWIAEELKAGRDAEAGTQTRTEILNIWRYLAARDGNEAKFYAPNEPEAITVEDLHDALMHRIGDTGRRLELEPALARTRELVRTSGESTIRGAKTAAETIDETILETRSGEAAQS